MKSKFVAGLDLGQMADYTALAIAECVQVATGETRSVRDRELIDGKTGRVQVLEREEPIMAAGYNFRHLARFPLGTSYPTVVANMVDLLTQEPLRGNTTLVVDATGVGPPVVDMLRRTALKPCLWAVTITGGMTVTRDGRNLNVPKRDLVSVVKVLLQTKRLKIAERLPEAATLTQELQNFQVKITASANDTYGSWREGQHDDLVLAVALACWFAEWDSNRPRWHSV